MSEIHDLAHAYVDDWATLDPCGATDIGVGGHDRELTDYSPEGAAARAEHARRTRAALARLEAVDDRDRIARAVMLDDLDVELELHDAGEWLRALNVIACPLQALRQCFDLMARTTTDDWADVATRMVAMPGALAGYRSALAEGLLVGTSAAPRQALACAEQAASWGGADEPSFFALLLDEYDRSSRRGADNALRADLARGANAASHAYLETARWLREEYAPRTDAGDAVGPERYARLARAFTGARLDLYETYEWGWAELRRIEDETERVAARILPDGSVAEVVEHLEHDSSRTLEGEEALRAWLQDLLDESVRALDGVHFDIPDPIKRVEAMIAPPGGAAAMYYTAPSEDFTRPGRTWYPTKGATHFPTWHEVSTCYHEGVPGHHLQVGYTVWLAEQLSRYQRVLGFNSGHGEGWALYAERLMGELGFLDDPAFELGMLTQHAFRAQRVVLDIGLHLQLPIPAGEDYHPAETWTPELAFPFALEHGRMPEAFTRSEIDRYLGWPGQAISYKVGERVWLTARDEARRAAGATFDLKRWHMAALDLGPMGLDAFHAEVARL